MNFSKTAGIVISVLHAASNATLAEQQTSLSDSIDRIHKVAAAKKYYDLSEKEKALIKEISEFGSEALPYLAELLKNDKREITVVAAEAIEEIADSVDVIDKKFLPAILHGLDNDHSGLPNVLAKVRTKEARAEYLGHYLADSSSPENQYQNGFRWYGADFLPSIVEVIQSDDGLSRNNVYLLGAALRCFPEDDRKAAAQHLMKLADDRDTEIQTKRAVLKMIGNLGPPALVVEDRLLAIWEAQLDLKDEAGEALIGIRSKKSGVILAEQLKGSPNFLLLRDIAEVGPAAKVAGTQVAELLDHSDWELRLGAARTIGFIGYRGADAKLVELVNDPLDVRLNLVAAESLGRLKSGDALMALDEAAKHHWHPAVRNAAKTAAGKIRSDSNYELKYHKENFPLEYFDYQYMGIALPEDFRIPAIINTSSIRVPEGWLLGADRGEWGGGLVFKGKETEHYRILEENINGLFKLGERFIAVTGLAHLTLNDGIVYELKVVDGKWRAERWRALPGAPQSSGKMKSGEVMVATYGGGVLILSENGQLRMADMTPKLEKSKE